MQYSFSTRVSSVESSAVRDILKLTQGKSIISFAGGLPAEEYFPMEAIRYAADRVLQQSPQALQYGLTEGRSYCGSVWGACLDRIGTFRLLSMRF